MVGVAKPFGRVKQALQKPLAIEERSVAKVVSVAIEKIEGEINDGYLREKTLAGGPHVHAFLEALEIAVTLGIQSDDLSVKNCLAGGQGIGKRGQFGIALDDVNAGTRAQRQGTILDSGLRANTVPLDFKEPVRIGKGAVGECRQHGFQARRHCGLARALQLRRLN